MSSERAELRALAHPTRVRIVELLRQHPSLTATECANMLHLTPKTCSFHLQTLAANGLVSEIAVSGRNRPWRLTSTTKDPTALTGTEIPTQPSPGPAARRTTRADDVRLRREESLLQGAADAIAGSAADAAWSAVATVHSHPTTMTPDELAAWCDDVERLTRRHVRRSAGAADPARVPVDLIFLGAPPALP